MIIDDTGQLVICPSCKATQNTMLEKDSEDRELITCYRCKRPYFRNETSAQFVSPDGHKIFAPWYSKPKNFPETLLPRES